MTEDELYDPDRDFAFIPPALDEGDEEEGFFKLTAREALQVKAIIAELVARRCESLKFYEELPAAGPFHRSAKFMRILRGGNRSSKTTSAARELACAVTGQDPYDKYPKRNGVAFVFGIDLKHLGLTVFPKLFQPGAFQCIKDAETGQWRTFRPWADGDRADEAIPAPPLIPPRFIQEIAWEDKKTKTPKMVRLTTGWVIWFFSSLANAPQGQNIDLFWIDEEVEADDLVDELTMRCLGVRKGRGFWSAAPQIGSRQMLELQEKFEDGNPDIDVWDLLIKDNPYIDEASKTTAFNILSEESRKVRWYGENAAAAAIVYPEFAESVHGFDPAAWGLKEPFSVPYDWPVYAAVDPGRQICAVNFWTVPPPKIGNWKLMFDELYIANCTAHLLGKSFAEKTRDRVIEAILIDHQAGRMTDMNYGHNVEEQYRKSLLENKVETRLRGCHFVWGSNDPKAGVLAFRELLRVKPDGKPSFYVYLPRCPNFVREIRRYRYKKIGRGPSAIITDEPEKRNDHSMDNSRYLAVFNPRYVTPAKANRERGGAMRALEAKKKRKREKGSEEAGTIRLG